MEAFIMDITEAEALTVLDILKAYDPTAGIITNYSGRYMVGSKCFAITTQNVALAAVAFAEALSGKQGIKVHVKTSRTDNFGYDTVLYFPYLEVKG